MIRTGAGPIPKTVVLPAATCVRPLKESSEAVEGKQGENVRILDRARADSERLGRRLEDEKFLLAVAAHSDLRLPVVEMGQETTTPVIPICSPCSFPVANKLRKRGGESAGESVQVARWDSLLGSTFAGSCSKQAWRV